MAKGRAGRFLNKVVSSLGTRINSVGMGLLMLMMLLTAADVLLRYFFNRPIKGAYELTEFMLVILVFFGLGYTAVKKRHIIVDVVVSRLPQQTQVAIDSVTCFLSLGVCFLVAWQSALEARTIWLAGQTSPSLHIPIFPFILMVVVGYTVLSLVLLRDLFDSLAQVVGSSWKVRLGLIFGGLIALGLITAPVWLGQLSLEVSGSTAGLFGMLLLLLLLVSRMPIGFALALLGFVGYASLSGLGPGLRLLGIVPYGTVACVSMSIIPLFILMAQFTFHSGIGRELYDTAHKWLGQLHGGLAMASVAACGAFAACTGSSVAGSIVMGRIALPEMKRYKYDSALATGCIAAGGTIGTLIPPSIAFVIYGIMTEQSIGKLFIAGIFPGILEVVTYIAVIYVLCRSNPTKGPAGPKATFTERAASLKGTWGMLALFVLVMGGIYGGLFTPTEAGAVGAFGAFVIALSRRKLNRQKFTDSLLETGQTTAMIFAIFVGAFIFGYFLTVTNLPMRLGSLIAGVPLNRYVILGFIFIFYLFLGCILDVGAMIVITIPIIFPIVMNLGFDPIWFGVFMVRVGEIGMITPPMGMNVFALSGVAKDIPLFTIFRGIMPFLIADIFNVVLLVAFPQISLFLPNMMS